jgi:cobalt transporter subunit CbtA
MTVFRRLVWVALCAGLLSGLFATAAHQIGTVPVILKAEVYEKAEQVPARVHEHAHSATHEHTIAWEPDNGVERTAYTLLADILAGVGFALLLAAGLTLRGGTASWRNGLFWGLAGFAAVTIAPGLGLPPELPGTEVAPLFARQLWWLATAVATGSGLALLAFTERAPWVVPAAILIVLPHLYGAPQLTEHPAPVTPEALSHQFVVAATVISFLFWLILGVSTGYFYSRFQGSAQG